MRHTICGHTINHTHNRSIQYKRLIHIESPKQFYVRFCVVQNYIAILITTKNTAQHQLYSKLRNPAQVGGQAILNYK